MHGAQNFFDKQMADGNQLFQNQFPGIAGNKIVLSDTQQKKFIETK